VELYLHSSKMPSWRGAQLKHRDKFTFTFVSTFMTYLHISHGYLYWSLVITIATKATQKLQATATLFYILKKTLKYSIFSKMNYHKIAGFYIKRRWCRSSRQKFGRPQCWYYGLQEVKNYRGGVTPSGMIFIRSCKKIRLINSF